MLVEALIDVCCQITPTIAAGIALAGVVAAHVIPYYLDPNNMRKYPGPFWAKFTDAWLGYVSKGGHRSEVIHQLHLKYGTHVRIAPNHLSIADPNALQIIYAHGNGALKSNFYDAFVSIRRGLFNTRDRAEHTRKRKIVSHIFSAKSVAEFEPRIREHVIMLANQWDRMCSGADKGMSGVEGDGWHGANGRLWMDCLPWMNYLAFDIIGDLAFGAPFGMLQAGKDTAQVPKSGEDKVVDDPEIKEVPAVKIINDRGEFSMSMGVLPPWWRPIVKKLPGYSSGHQAVKTLAGIAIVAVLKRLNTPTDRVDLLSKLQAGKDEEGKPMGREELTAEALTQLIAGSDTTSNTSCAVLYYLARNQHIQTKLQEELDEQLGAEDETASTLEQVKHLPYLDKVLNETMRIHSTSALGLPRVVPEGGIDVTDDHFPAGAILSVPSYTIHRDKHVWGEDPDEFRPERWDEQDDELIQKTFNPFSYGPRACVGRNLAFLELQIIISSLVRRYHFVLEKEDQPLDTSEGFLRKPVSCRVGIKRRD